MRRVVAETGILRGRRKRAVDSTILADAVATQDTITQLVSAIRRVGRIVPGGAEAITAVCTGHDYSRPGKPSIDWDEPGAKDALVSALVNDANAVLEALAGIDEDGEPVAAALALLALVAGQDVEPAEGSDGTDGRWRIARKVAPDRVISMDGAGVPCPAGHVLERGYRTPRSSIVNEEEHLYGSEGEEDQSGGDEADHPPRDVEEARGGPGDHAGDDRRARLPHLPIRRRRN